MIELCVVESIEQVNSAGTGSAKTHAEFSGVLGIGAGHKCSGLLMTNVNEPDVVLLFSKGLHNAVDAVSGKSEDDFDAPVDERVYQNVCSCSGHGVLSCALLCFSSVSFR